MSKSQFRLVIQPLRRSRDEVHEYLVFVGLVAALLPHTIGIFFGRFVLRMEPLIVLGACAGAGTITAALRAIQDEARSSIPAFGYTVPYAIGNILLTAWGPVLVALMAKAQ